MALIDKRRIMRMQIERDKEIMSKKFEKLQKSKNVSDADMTKYSPSFR